MPCYITSLSLVGFCALVSAAGVYTVGFSLPAWTTGRIAVTDLPDTLRDSLDLQQSTTHVRVYVGLWRNCVYELHKDTCVQAEWLSEEWFFVVRIFACAAEVLFPLSILLSLCGCCADPAERLGPTITFVALLYLTAMCVMVSLLMFAVSFSGDYPSQSLHYAYYITIAGGGGVLIAAVIASVNIRSTRRKS